MKRAATESSKLCLDGERIVNFWTCASENAAVRTATCHSIIISLLQNPRFEIEIRLIEIYFYTSSPVVITFLVQRSEFYAIGTLACRSGIRCPRHRICGRIGTIKFHVWLFSYESTLTGRVAMLIDEILTKSSENIYVDIPGWGPPFLSSFGALFTWRQRKSR